MKTSAQLKKEILSLNGRGYPAYKSLKGSYDFGDYILFIDHVQSDPFASPSDVSIQVEKPGFPAVLYENRACRIALQDNLLRLFYTALKKSPSNRSGSGKSGKIQVSRPVQEVLERSVCTINPKTGALSLKMNIGFPARGRSILAGELVRILFDQLPVIVHSTLFYDALTPVEKESLEQSRLLTNDQEYIRSELPKRKLAAFVANGAILPRQSGISALPMDNAKPFVSPKEDQVSFDLPSGRTIEGLGIPQGITLIVGGGYHGKSTLLEALEKGVYNHIIGDGREFVLSRADAMKIRAEDGRAVHNEDISLFIGSLSDGRSTTRFVSEDASGSTSQAANVMEALESGSSLLLMDEDTSATNFMIRDALMAAVVSSDQEPIIPFVERVRPICDDFGASTILVAGSSGAYFDQADLVLQMKDYEPYDITQKAKEQAAAFGMLTPKAQAALPKAPLRIPLPVEAVRKEERVKVKTVDTDTLSIARQPIDVRYLEQIADSEQLKAIGKILVKAEREWIDGTRTMEEVAERIEQELDDKGLGAFGNGAMARPRRQEIMGVLNRWRAAEFRQA